MISAVEGEEEAEVVSADDNGNETKSPLTWGQRWHAFWLRKKMLVTPPYIGLLVLCCFVDFGLMFRLALIFLYYKITIKASAELVQFEKEIGEIEALKSYGKRARMRL